MKSTIMIPVKFVKNDDYQQETVLNKNKNSGLIEKTGESLWNLFASLKLSVFLFASISIASILGTLIPDQMVIMKFLSGKPVFWSEFVNFMELYHYYTSWWFVLLIILLGVNIVCCSIERLPGVFKIVFKKPSPASAPRIEALANKKSINMDMEFEKGIERVRLYFGEKKLKIHENENVETYTAMAEKGRWTRLGVYITHLGFLLLIIGGLIGSLRGFSGNIEIPEQEEESVVRLFGNKGRIDLGFKVRCNSFKIKRYSDHTPKSFESEIEIIENNTSVFKDIVMVNKPLKYNGIKFIQSGYGRSLDGPVTFGLYKSINDEKVTEYVMNPGERIEFPDKKTSFTLFSFRPNFHISKLNLGETFIGFILKDNKEIAVALPVKNPGFDKHRRGTYYLKIEGFKTKYYTSLQVNKDPGVAIVYMGFLLLIAGCLISFFMVHKSYYILVKKSGDPGIEIIMGVNANKRKEILENELHIFEKDFNGIDVRKEVFNG